MGKTVKSVKAPARAGAYGKSVKSIMGKRHRQLQRTPRSRITSADVKRLGLRAGITRSSSVQIREKELDQMQDDIKQVVAIAYALAKQEGKKRIDKNIMKMAWKSYCGLVIYG